MSNAIIQIGSPARSKFNSTVSERNHEVKIHWLLFGTALESANVANISNRADLTVLTIIMTVIPTVLGMWQGMTYGSLWHRGFPQMVQDLFGIVGALFITICLVIINVNLDFPVALYASLVWFGTYIMGTQLKLYYD